MAVDDERVELECRSWLSDRLGRPVDLAGEDAVAPRLDGQREGDVFRRVDRALEECPVLGRENRSAREAAREAEVAVCAPAGEDSAQASQLAVLTVELVQS